MESLNFEATPSSSKDWFEFLLDLNLLDKHLKSSSPDPSGSSLIVHFLYHANLTEQLFSSNGQIKPQQNAETLPVEIKTKRVKVLRILAIKAASILNWNLLILEKEVPVAVMSDLLHILLKFTLQINENKSHNQLDLKIIDSHGLFALQLLHRWCIRTSIFSKYPTKPSKTIQVNVPGIINPLQHMKEANENILKTLSPTSVFESVEFLEKFLSNLTNDLIKPSTLCFSNINSETGEYSQIWSNGFIFSMKECELLIKFDLAQYYFFIENYHKCFNLLNSNLDLYYSIVNDDEYKETCLYCIDYEALLFASKSLINIDNLKSDMLIIDEYKPLKSANLLINRVENSIKNDFYEIFELLIEDNKKSELSISYRLNLEKLTNSSEIIDQISSCNLVRCIHEDYYSYKNYDLSKLNYLSKAISQSHSNKFKSNVNMKIFLKINYKYLNKKCQQELENDVNYNFMKLFNLGQNIDGQQQLMDYQETSPSSPTDTQNPSFTSNATLLEYVQLGVKSIDQTLIKHAILNYNQQTQNKGMRNYWVSEWNIQSILEYLQPQQMTIFQNNLNKINSVNDIDFIIISLAKIKKLKKTKKYDLALKLLKNLEDSVKNNDYLTKYIVNETLILNLKKIINSLNNDQIKNTRFYDQMLNNCKTFIINSSKSDVNDISLDALQTAFAFILNSNEYRFIENQSIHKTSPINVGYVEFSKKIVKFCIESQSEKGTSRKTARDLWECIVEIFMDSSQTKRTIEQDPQSSTTIARESQTACLSRESFCKIIKLINNTQILGILLSLISTLYTIRDSSCNTELLNEYRQLWPSSLVHMSSVNLNFLFDILNILIKHCLTIDPFNTIWLRTIADFYFSQAHFNEALKYYFKLILCESKYFFQQNQLQRALNEKLLRNMIRSCFQMNKFTQVICLSQYLPKVDYTLAFKCFQEETCYDNMDDLYICIWDLALLEYLVYINSKKAYIDKRNLGMNIISLPESNESNPSEIRDKNIELKRILLFIKLIKYYFL